MDNMVVVIIFLKMNLKKNMELKFLTTTFHGDGNGRKVLPGCLFSVLSRKKFKFIESGKISIIFDVLHFYSDTNDCRHSIELDGADKIFLNSNGFIYKFLNSVSDKNLKNTYLKFHPFEKRSEFSFRIFFDKKF